MNNVYEKFNFPENPLSNMDPPRRRRQALENVQSLSPPRRIRRIFEVQPIDDRQPVSCPIQQTNESIQCDNQTVGSSQQTTIQQRPVIDCRRHKPKCYPRSDNVADEAQQAGCSSEYTCSTDRGRPVRTRKRPAFYREEQSPVRRSQRDKSCDYAICTDNDLHNTVNICLFFQT